MTRLGPRVRSVFLGVSGVEARWEPDEVHAGAWVLHVGGAEQSTLVPGAPTRLVYEYLARAAHLLDAALSRRGADTPPSILHLGGGALSLPRYIETRHPGARQVVVDLDRELMPFVLAAFPLSAPSDTRLIIGDVREALPEALSGGRFDACLLDIALDQHSPAALLGAGFARELLDAVGTQGTVVVNIGDDPGLPATRRLVDAFRAAGASLWVTGPSYMLEGEDTGNLLLVASRSAWSEELRETVVAQGPHPAGAVAGIALDGLGLG